jgi:hypothetical protein
VNPPSNAASGPEKTSSAKVWRTSARRRLPGHVPMVLPPRACISAERPQPATPLAPVCRDVPANTQMLAPPKQWHAIEAGRLPQHARVAQPWEPPLCCTAVRHLLLRAPAGGDGAHVVAPPPPPPPHPVQPPLDKDGKHQQAGRLHAPHHTSFTLWPMFLFFLER